MIVWKSPGGAILVGSIVVGLIFGVIGMLLFQETGGAIGGLIGFVGCGVIADLGWRSENKLDPMDTRMSTVYFMPTWIFVILAGIVIVVIFLTNGGSG